jgi:hypothetical protein
MHIHSPLARQPLEGFTITLKTPHAVELPGQVISPTQRPLPDDTQHSQQTDIHASGGNRTRNPSMLAAADPRLTERGHWDRQQMHIRRLKIIVIYGS